MSESSRRLHSPSATCPNIAQPNNPPINQPTKQSSMQGPPESKDQADNVGLSPVYNTATAPETKRGQHRKDERTDFEAEPPSSNSWAAPIPADPLPERSVPMTAEDERHMREDLGRDPAQLLAKQQENVSRLQQRQQDVMQAAPGQSIDEVAAADVEGTDPAAAAAAMPKPTAETIDSNNLGSEEGKNTPDVFVRKETGT